MERSDGSYMHQRTIEILQLNPQGKSSDTYYYIEGLLHCLEENHLKRNKAEVCLLQMNVVNGSTIAAIAVDDYLETSSNLADIHAFCNIMNVRCKIKRLGIQNIYLGQHLHHASFPAASACSPTI